MSVIIVVIVVDDVVVVIAIAIVIVAAVLLCSVLLSLGMNNYFCCFGNLTNIPNNMQVQAAMAVSPITVCVRTRPASVIARELTVDPEAKVCFYSRVYF